MRYDDHKWKPGRSRRTMYNPYGGAKRGYKWERSYKDRARTRELIHRIINNKIDPESTVWPVALECSDWWDFD